MAPLRFLMALTLTSLTSVACGRRDAAAPVPAEQPPAPRPAVAADCAAVALHVRGVLTVELAGVPGAIAPLDRALRVATASCEADGWPEPLRRCLLAVPFVGPERGSRGLLGCAAHVPAKLREALEPKIRAVL
jgi:hypothetical protein